jgi:sulfide:quinone oxidoreductase
MWSAGEPQPTDERGLLDDICGQPAAGNVLAAEAAGPCAGDAACMASTTPLHIVIAGGGVGGVETALALHDLGGDAVRLTLVAPGSEFELRALRTAEPFVADHVRRRSLRDLAAATGARLVTDTVAAIQPDRHAVRLSSGEPLTYDALVIAVGARRRAVFPRALTFAGDEHDGLYHGLLADLEEHWTRSVAFVVPPGTTWALPLYELALQTAVQVRSMGIDDAQLRVVSPEAAPLAIFGPQAGHAIAGLLDQAGIRFTGETYVSIDERGQVLDAPSGLPLDEQRVVALPVLEGPALLGVPSDTRGFIPIDEHGRVLGTPDVFAAGDGTTFPVKQGGLACQMADAIAEQLAARAGAPVEPRPFRPVLRGRLLTGRGAQLLSHALHGGIGADPVPRPVLWSAPHKVDGRYLSAWLGEVEPADPRGGERDAQAEQAIDVEVPLPNAWEEARKELLLDPYSPPFAAL